MPSPPDSPSTFPRLVGRAVERVEDAALLTGRGRLADDMGERPGTAHAAGRRYGIGFAAVVEPSISNMGYITMALTARERARAGPKDGAAASATVAIDPIGSIAAHVASVPQGQGHRTVLWREPAVAAANLPNVNHSPAWLIAATAVGSPPTQCSTPIAAG